MAHIPDSESAPKIEDFRDALVDAFNARDLDGVGELLGEEVTSDVFDGVGVEAALHGLSDLWIRYPLLVASRGDCEGDSVIALWFPGEEGKFRSVGFLELTIEDGAIEHVTYIDDDEAELTAEPPDESELAEWFDWAEWDRGEETTPEGPFG
ncbi:hypothetical protein BMS3Abin02_00806 [bacterium BMS3Abin02]|nr:hypothetical protein BMS3Abin02_00806 [bacterium BMS3Abin02]GBE23311.1 hypothetical protein BMS3Bbin01_02695 [bacterium BMS3Bbin01]HDH24646.1 hypothetical protein [Actinomycetota bacterium]HDK44934.1 hypothetical protein [Actinomycetota bacterium]HDL50151.1 hypothetical protein [Actinomycetota bacterium]